MGHCPNRVSASSDPAFISMTIANYVGTAPEPRDTPLKCNLLSAMARRDQNLPGAVGLPCSGTERVVAKFSQPGFFMCFIENAPNRSLFNLIPAKPA